MWILCCGWNWGLVCWFVGEMGWINEFISNVLVEFVGILEGIVG